MRLGDKAKGIENQIKSKETLRHLIALTLSPFEGDNTTRRQGEIEKESNYCFDFIALSRRQCDQETRRM